MEAILDLSSFARRVHPDSADVLADPLSSAKHGRVALGAPRLVDVRKPMDQSGTICAVELTREDRFKTVARRATGIKIIRAAANETEALVILNEVKDLRLN